MPHFQYGSIIIPQRTRFNNKTVTELIIELLVVSQPPLLPKERAKCRRGFSIAVRSTFHRDVGHDAHIVPPAVRFIGT